MSTLAIYAKGRRGVIVSDTAGLDGDGVVRGWVSKIITVPHLRMAVTTRGAIAALPAFATDLVAEFPTFDAIVEHGAPFLAELHDAHMMRLADQSGCGEFDLAVVGWSTARGRVEAHAISSLDHPGLPPFTWMRNDVLVAPVPPHDAMARVGLMVGGVLRDDDPVGVLLGLVELQRQMRIPVGGVPGMPERHIVGGQAVVTEITEDGIAQRIVKAWSDRIDEWISPAPASEQPGAMATTGMSRQQRRVAQAQARKMARA